MPLNRGFIFLAMKIINCKKCEGLFESKCNANIYCKECSKKSKLDSNIRYAKSEKCRLYRANYRKTEKYKEYAKSELNRSYQINFAKTEKGKKISKKYYMNKIKMLTDGYIKNTFKLQDATPELIELKRTQIMIKRELKAKLGA